MAKTPLIPKKKFATRAGIFERNTEFFDLMRSKGALAKPLWEAKGPDGSDVAFVTAYDTPNGALLVTTYKKGGYAVFPEINVNDLGAQTAFDTYIDFVKRMAAENVSA